MSELVREPFTNKLGQVINPGDRIVCVATGHNHSVKIYEAIFDGVRYDNISRYKIRVDTEGNLVKNANGYIQRIADAKREIVSVRVKKPIKKYWDYKVTRTWIELDEPNWKWTYSTLPLMRIFKL